MNPQYAVAVTQVSVAQARERGRMACGGDALGHSFFPYLSCAFPGKVMSIFMFLPDERMHTRQIHGPNRQHLSHQPGISTGSTRLPHFRANGGRGMSDGHL